MDQASVVIVLVFFTAVAGLSLTRQRRLRLGQLGRLLLPSWKLFDRDSPALSIELRVGADGHSLGPWRAYAAPGSDAPFDPQRSLAWGWRALLAQLAADVGETDADAPQALLHEVSYRLVRQALERDLAAPTYQFKLTADETLFVSAVHSR